MSQNLDQTLRLEVPVIVRLAERSMRMSEVLALVPGAIIELPKNSEDELDLLVNNKAVGSGTAVKVGENFGIRLTFIGDLRTRITALGPAASADADADAAPASADAGLSDDELAERLLAGQI